MIYLLWFALLFSGMGGTQVQSNQITDEGRGRISKSTQTQKNPSRGTPYDEQLPNCKTWCF